MGNKQEQESSPTKKQKSSKNNHFKIKNSSTFKKEIEIMEKYETQVKIPKPILIEIVQLCGLENFLKISLISKQFYFLLKSENFWLKMLKTTDLDREEIEKERKTKSLVEIYKDAINGWDVKASYPNWFKFEGKEFTHIGNSGKQSVVTKKKFVTGEENVLFVFQSGDAPKLHALGIKKEEL